MFSHSPSYYEATDTECRNSNVTENVVPFPKLLVTSIRRWCFSIKRPSRMKLRNGRTS